MLPHRLSIADLARELKLSPSTVSRALADHAEVNEATRLRVQQLAKERGYQPNQVAVALRKGRSNTLGVLVPHLTGSFFPEVVDGMTEAASAAGYNIMICQSHDDVRQERRSLALLLQAPVAGVLVSLASTTHEFAHFEAMQAAGLPLVFFDRAAAGFTGPGVSSVVLDDYAGAYAATAHLLAEGYQRIACFSGPQHLGIYQQRYEGYCQALRDHGRPYAPELVYHAPQPDQRTGASLMRELLALPAPPDAIFSASDAAVVGALQVLKEQGRRIPGDVALAGFSNAEFTAFTDPPLTTVDQCSHQMGREAVRQLLGLLGAGPLPVSPVVLRPRLLVRASSKRVAGPVAASHAN